MTLDVSVIIVSYNTKELLARAIQSVMDHVKGVTHEVIVVDNASRDGSPEMVSLRFPDVKLIRSCVNAGFGAANNLGAREAAGKYLFLLNSDAMLTEDTAAGLLSFLEKNTGYAAAGPGVLLPDRTRQPKICGPLPTMRRIFNDALLLSALFPGVDFFQGMHMDRPTAKVTPVGWLSGVCMLIRREPFETAGGFDERFFLYAEDMDLCRRLGIRGWKLAHVDDFAIVHECGGSAATPADVVRKSVLQQTYFLAMLAGMFDSRQLAAARLLLFSGLVLRVFAGLAAKLGPARHRGLLLETSLARLKILLGKG